MPFDWARAPSPTNPSEPPLPIITCCACAGTALVPSRTGTTTARRAVSAQANILRYVPLRLMPWQSGGSRLPVGDIQFPRLGRRRLPNVAEAAAAGSAARTHMAAGAAIVLIGRQVDTGAAAASSAARTHMAAGAAVVLVGRQEDTGAVAVRPCLAEAGIA